MDYPPFTLKNRPSIVLGLVWRLGFGVDEWMSGCTGSTGASMKDGYS